MSREHEKGERRKGTEKGQKRVTKGTKRMGFLPLHILQTCLWRPRSLEGQCAFTTVLAPPAGRTWPRFYRAGEGASCGVEPKSPFLAHFMTTYYGAV